MQLSQISLNLVRILLTITTISCANASEFKELERELAAFYNQLSERNQVIAEYASVFGIPSGAVGIHGSGYVAGFAATLPDTATGSTPFDASALVGISLGDADEIAFGVNLGIISVNPIGNKQALGFGEDGNLNFKLSKRIDTYRQQNFDFAVGLNNFIAWGEAKSLPGRGYLALSTNFTSARRRAFALNFGKQFEENIFTKYFFGVGVGLMENVSISAAAIGEALTLGVGIIQPGDAKSKYKPYQVNIGMSSVGKENERFIVSISKPFKWN